MKIARITCCLFVLLLSLVAFAFSTSAPRAHAASGTTIVLKFHGPSVFANFDNVSPDGCIETAVSVDASQNTVHNQTISEADILIGQFDNCTGILLLDAFGSNFNANFQVGNKLLSAALNTTISVTDILTGNTFPVSVNLAWTSTSAITHEDQIIHFHTQGFIANAHFNADFRLANASGTVSAGTTNFTPSPSVFAQIALAKDVSVAITLP